ncbi:YdeI/OmpD-associated family protein [Nonomuraea gerenzanensis]|uniref:Uncharacterized protein n=1 Tax=Nonomuraea gerenzanensis TaxID=93944 RepID=A0A1M4EQZ7_9ACTN|nr:YdeI/OmpD-associated family protein [Nonomuraea gerenzanensis]UBU12717.1 YdeI/OmpD-associated family protein [Nonomuraea gerenzanensis]SBP01272.1 hypothetical protein BN4615_P10788 [Nonomuraea gerenzanensis]
MTCSAENRQGCGVAAGDEAEVEVTLDTAPRVPCSRKRWHALSVEGAKKPWTRQRRVADAVAELAGGVGRRPIVTGA